MKNFTDSELDKIPINNNKTDWRNNADARFDIMPSDWHDVEWFVIFLICFDIQVDESEQWSHSQW